MIGTQEAHVRQEAMLADVRNRLAETLTRKGMSLKELERKTWALGESVSYQTLLNIYHNRLSGITFRVMSVICEATGTTIGEMFYLDGDSPDRKGLSGGD